MTQPEEIFYFANGEMNKGYVISRAYANAVQIDVDGKGTAELHKLSHCYLRDQLHSDEIAAAEDAFRDCKQ